MKIDMMPGERIEELGCGVRVIQDPSGFCYGTDAVMLARFVSAAPGNKLIDFCTGTAIVPLLLSMRTPCTDMTGLEIQESVADMAKRSVELNDLGGRIRIINGDLRDCRTLFAAECADIVTCNPPYMKCNSGKQNACDSKTIARHEVCCTLEDVVKSAAYLLKTGGRFYLVHRPERLADAVGLMKQYRLEPKRMQLVHSRLEAAPSLVLLEGQKGRRSGLRVLEPALVKGVSEFIQNGGGNHGE